MAPKTMAGEVQHDDDQHQHANHGVEDLDSYDREGDMRGDGQLAEGGCHRFALILDPSLGGREEGVRLVALVRPTSESVSARNRAA